MERGKLNDKYFVNIDDIQRRKKKRHPSILNVSSRFLQIKIEFDSQLMRLF